MLVRLICRCDINCAAPHCRTAQKAPHLGLRKVKRPLQTIGCSGRLTMVTLPILTRSRPWLSCVRVILKTIAKQYSVTLEVALGFYTPRRSVYFSLQPRRVRCVIGVHRMFVWFFCLWFLLLF